MASDKDWYVPEYRNAWPRYRAQRVKWADFAGVCITLDTRAFWTRRGAEQRADQLNREAGHA